MSGTPPRDELITPDQLSLDAQWRQPGPEFFKSTEEQYQNARDTAITRIRDAIAGHVEGEGAAIVIADADADGLGAQLVLQQVYGMAALIHAGPHGTLTVDDALTIVVEHLTADIDVWVADIRPDDDRREALDAVLVDDTITVRWFDHHEWSDEMVTTVESHVDELVIDPGHNVSKEEERCAAELVADYVEDTGLATLPDHIREAVWVTGVYDTWKKTADGAFIDTRAEDLHDYADLTTDPADYLAAVEEYGADIMTDANVAEAIEAYRDHQQALNDRALDEATISVINETTGRSQRVSERNWDKLATEGVEDDEWVVATTYGNCETNTVADELGELGVDVVAVVKPTGKVSFRSRGTFDACHRIAERFGGGGHETAAGGHLTGAETNRVHLDSMAAYADLWASCGREARVEVRHTIRDVLVDE